MIIIMILIIIIIIIIIITVMLILTPCLMEPGGSIPHSQGLSNNSYPVPKQSNSPHWYLSLQGSF